MHFLDNLDFSLIENRDQNWWDLWFLGLAEYMSTASKDQSTKVGAVITNGKRIVSTGYNGFAAGIKDTAERINNREVKYAKVIHGEINAILWTREDLCGFTLYTWPFQPCDKCAQIVIQKGIKRVVAPYSENPRWLEEFKKAQESFQEVGVELVLLKI